MGDTPRAVRRFNQGRKGEVLKQDICNAFDLNAGDIAIPVVVVGIERYSDAIGTFMGSLSNTRFECEEMQSPLQGLQAQERELLARISRLHQAVAGFNQRIQSVQQRIASLPI